MWKNNYKNANLTVFNLTISPGRQAIFMSLRNLIYLVLWRVGNDEKIGYVYFTVMSQCGVHIRQNVT